MKKKILWSVAILVYLLVNFIERGRGEYNLFLFGTTMTFISVPVLYFSIKWVASFIRGLYRLLTKSANPDEHSRANAEILIGLPTIITIGILYFLTLARDREKYLLLSISILPLTLVSIGVYRWIKNLYTPDTQSKGNTKKFFLSGIVHFLLPLCFISQYFITQSMSSLLLDSGLATYEIVHSDSMTINGPDSYTEIAPKHCMGLKIPYMQGESYEEYHNRGYVCVGKLSE